MLSTILGGVVDDRQHSNGYRQAVLYKRGLNFMIMGLTKLVCCKCDVYSREMEELPRKRSQWCCQKANPHINPAQIALCNSLFWIKIKSLGKVFKVDTFALVWTDKLTSCVYSELLIFFNAKFESILIFKILPFPHWVCYFIESHSPDIRSALAIVPLAPVTQCKLSAFPLLVFL